MILFIFFLALYTGINFKVVLPLGVIESIAIIIFAFYRFKKKIGAITLASLLLGVGLSFIKPSVERDSYQSLVVEVRENYFIAICGLEKLYVYEKENTREIGDIIEIHGQKKTLEFTTLESSFDFEKYLNNKGIYSEIKTTKIVDKFSTPLKINKLRKRFLSHFDNDTKALISSMFFGISDSEETTSLFRELHLSRLISNSGIILDLFLSVFLFLLTYKLKDK